jgi:hypothetical protein
VPARRADRPSLPLTPGRGLTLLAGVPVAVILIAITGFQFVGAVGRASFPVSQKLTVRAGQFALHTGGGDVNLRGTPGRGSTARLAGTVSYSLVRPEVFLDDGAGRSGIRLSCPLGSLASCGFDASVALPASTAVTAETDGGNILASGLSGAVRLSTSGGDIRATALTGRADLSTDGGNVTVGQLSGTTVLHTSGGDITGTGITAGTFTAGTDGGNIRLTFAAPPGHLDVSTSGGDITILLPRDLSFTVNARSSSGDVRNNTTAPGPASPSSGYITATTDGGNITIEYAPAGS